MPKRKTLIIIIATVIILVIAGVAVTGLSGAAKTSSAAASTKTSTNTNKTSVKVMKAAMAPITADTSFSASLIASEEGSVSTKVSGKVIQVLFEDGKVVSQGEALAKLDDTDIRNNIKTSQAQLAASQSQLNAAQIGLQNVQTNLQTAQQNYNRQKALYDQQIISAVDFESAQATLRTAQANLETSKAGIKTQQASLQASKTSLSILNESLKNTTITAPISGVMDQKNVVIGQFLNAGTVLGKVENVSPICATIQVNQSDLNYVKLGANVKFKLNQDDSKEYSGVIENIDGAADPASRAFTCKIKIQDNDGMLKPGVFGNVIIAENQNRNTIALPTNTLGGTAGNYYVFINKNGVAKKQAITTGRILQNSVEVTSGVTDGDSIICSNVATLQDGDAVTVVTE